MQNLPKIKRIFKMPSDIFRMLTHIVMFVKIPREGVPTEAFHSPRTPPPALFPCGGKCWLPFRTVALVPLRGLQMRHLPIGKWQLLFNPEPCHLHALFLCVPISHFLCLRRNTLLTNNCSSYHVTTSISHVPLMTWKRGSPAFLT